MLGPGQGGKFPSTKSGLQVSNLSSDKQALVLSAIKLYVNDLDASSASAILTKYTSDLANTYIAFSGNTSMSVQNDYVRIDGPHVWIEFSYQGGVIIKIRLILTRFGETTAQIKEIIKQLSFIFLSTTVILQIN